MKDNNRSSKILKTSLNKKSTLTFALTLFAVFGLVAAIVAFYNFRRGVNKASEYVTCNAPSFDSPLDVCTSQNGFIGGAVNSNGDICCTLQIPASAYPGLQTASSADTIPNNCCNRDDYGSCVGSDDAQTKSLFQQGYLACQNSQCGACEYKSTESVTAGLTASYYSDINQNTLFTTQTENSINYNWNSVAPFEGMPIDGFSVVWEGYLNATEAGSYTFNITADDSVRLWINDKLIINGLVDSQTATRTLTGETEVVDNSAVPFKLLYADISGSASINLTWNLAYSGNTPSLVSSFTSQKRDVTSSPILEGDFVGISDSEVVSGSRNVYFTADPDTTSSVQFLIDNNLINTDSDSTYDLGGGIFDFDTLASGTHTLLAKVYSIFADGYYKKSINFVTQAFIPATLDLPVIQDTHVNSAYPNNDYGDLDYLRVDGSPERITYLKFDLSNLPVDASNLTSATVNVHVQDSSGAEAKSESSIFDVSSSWNDTMTYNTRPSLGNLITTISATTRNAWASADITDSVKRNWGSVYSVAVEQADRNALVLDSLESANPAYITLTFSSTTTPSSTPTPTTAPTPVPSPIPSGAPTPTPTPVTTPTPTATPVNVDNWVGVNSGDKVWGTIFVAYNNPNVSEKYVEFSIDDPNNNVINFDRKAPFEVGGSNGFDVTQLSAGSHNLYAKVKDSNDKGGGYSYTEAIEIIVEDPGAAGISTFDAALEFFGF